jgi:hypothetical protein
MRRTIRILLILLVAALLLAGGVLAVLYRAAQRVPEFYEEAVQVEPAAQQQAYEQMQRQATALQNNLQRPGNWQAVFTAEQINGWLALDLARGRGSLPAALSDPRVRIDAQGITVACRARWKGLRTVVSLRIEAYLDSPNVLGLRLRQARAGAIPFPKDGVLKAVREAARRADVRIKWLQTDGDPVALISLSEVDAGAGRAVRLENLSFEPNAIHISGTTTKGKRS